MLLKTQFLSKTKFLSKTQFLIETQFLAAYAVNITLDEVDIGCTCILCIYSTDQKRNKTDVPLSSPPCNFPRGDRVSRRVKNQDFDKNQVFDRIMVFISKMQVSWSKTLFLIETKILKGINVVFIKNHVYASIM